jgi:glucokinase
MTARDLYLGIDLGGSKILAGVVAADGRVLSRAKNRTPFAKGGKALLAALSETSAEALGTAGTDRARIVAVGMGSPGPLDPERGVILRTPNIAVEKLAVGPFLARELDAPFVLDNDVHMALYGELVAGAAKGHRDVVGIWVGTGVGGAVIMDGRLVHGANRNAGEIGHIILDASREKKGRPRGTLEWTASKTGIARRIVKSGGKKSKLAKKLRGEKKRDADRLHSSDLADAVAAGDRAAVDAVRRSAEAVGIAVANVWDLLAPELFVLGGGVVASLGKSYVAMVRETADAFAFSTELSRIRIATSRLGDDAGMLGAAFAARDAHPVTPASTVP